MKKIKILLIVIIASIGAIIIYNKFDTKKIEVNEVDKHLMEYNLLPENNIYEFANIDKVINITNKTGVIIFCNPASSWCQYYMKTVNDTLSNNGINKIYYSDIKEDRNNNTLKYQKLVSILSDYLRVDDTNNKLIIMPYLIFIKDGKVMSYDDTFSHIDNPLSADEYFSNEKAIKDLENKLIDKINLYNN